MLSEEDDCFSEPDQKPGCCMRLVPCISDHCVRGPPCVRASPPRPPLPLPHGERKGGRGRGGRASRAPQHQDGRRCTPLPSRKGDASPACQRFLSATIRYLSFGMPLENRINIQVFDHTRSTCRGVQLPVPPAVSLCHTSLVVYRQRIVGRLLNPDPASVSSGGDYVSMR
jgi:hypothetical protein